MNYTIRGDKVVVTAAIKEYITTKLDKMTKYFDKAEEVNVNVLIKVKGKAETVEVTIRTDHFLLRCEETTNDLYKSIDLSVDVLERQITKNKKRIASKILNENIKDIILDFEKAYDETDEDNGIVKRKKLETKPMDEEEAILEMNLLKHDFFIFKDSETFKIKVLYRRKDGDYGIIETI